MKHFGRKIAEKGGIKKKEIKEKSSEMNAKLPLSVQKSVRE